jgi:hypothetical protein
MANFFEEALSSLGAAVADVREKVVEEAYFGRSLSDGGAPAVEAPEQQPGFGSLTTTNIFDQSLADKVQEAAPVERSQDNTPEPGGGMER